MPYFNNNADINILFIHIPKTGGTSLETYFSKKYTIPLTHQAIYGNNSKVHTKSTLQHMTYQNIFDANGKSSNDVYKINYENITIIAIVRNPYERIISDLFYWKLINKNTRPDRVFNSIKTYLEGRKFDNHDIPQYLFVTNNDKELIPAIKIIHTENLNKEMIELGFSDFNVRENVNRQQLNYYNYLNNDAIQLINEFYDYDFKLFNYEKLTSVPEPVSVPEPRLKATPNVMADADANKRSKSPEPVRRYTRRIPNAKML